MNWSLPTTNNLLELCSPKKEVEKLAKLTQFGQYKCSESCHKYSVFEEYQSPFPDDKELDRSRCEHFAKFEHLCKLVREKRSGDLRILAIEKWLCLTSMRLEESFLVGYFNKCQDDSKYPDTYQKEAQQTLESVLSYSLDQLEETKNKIDEEIEASDKLRKEHDYFITADAFSKLRKKMEKLPEYIKCSKKNGRRKRR